MFSSALYDCEKKHNMKLPGLAIYYIFFRTGIFTAVRGRMQHSKLECESGKIGQENVFERGTFSVEIGK